MTAVDRWGLPLAGATSSGTAWDQAWAGFLRFRGDPMALLADANRHDTEFVLGPVFCAAYRILAGAPAEAPPLRDELSWSRERARTGSERDRHFVDALELLAAGAFTEAARRWDQAAEGTLDLPAVRLAHDIYLHVGDAEGRLVSSQAAIHRWTRADPGWGFVQGQHAFALEESGHYDEAERLGREALAVDPDDLWARHALAHVYESTDNQDAALRLLRGEQDRWRTQELLSTHMWWHLALRLLSVGDADAVFAIYDDLVPVATTAFRLCDLTSLLWRLELEGVAVANRWDHLADAWAARAERHTCGFLDIHATLAFARRPDHPGAEQWRAGLAAAHDDGDNENADTFRTIVRPLAAAFTAYGQGRHRDVVATLEALGGSTRRIGGSVAQRDLIERTLAASKHELTTSGPGAAPGRRGEGT